MKIREAIPEDAKAIATVHLASWKTTYPGMIPQSYIDELKLENGIANWSRQIEHSNAIILVAEDEDGIFGFAAGGATVHTVDGFDAELGSIYLLATHQRRGAGRELVANLALGLRQQGFKSCVVWALEANPACDFYQRLGGVRVAEQPIEIGGVALPEVAFGWTDIRTLCPTLHTDKTLPLGEP